MMAASDASHTAAPPTPRGKDRLSKTRTDKRKADELAATAATRPVAATPPVSRNGLPLASLTLLPQVSGRCRPR